MGEPRHMAELKVYNEPGIGEVRRVYWKVSLHRFAWDVWRYQEIVGPSTRGGLAGRAGPTFSSSR